MFHIGLKLITLFLLIYRWTSLMEMTNTLESTGWISWQVRGRTIDRSTLSVVAAVAVVVHRRRYTKYWFIQCNSSSESPGSLESSLSPVGLVPFQGCIIPPLTPQQDFPPQDSPVAVPPSLKPGHHNAEDGASWKGMAKHQGWLLHNSTQVNHRVNSGYNDNCFGHLLWMYSLGGGDHPILSFSYNSFIFCIKQNKLWNIYSERGRLYCEFTTIWILKRTFLEFSSSSTRLYIVNRERWSPCKRGTSTWESWPAEPSTWPQCWR